MGDQHLSLPRIHVIRDGHDPLDLQVINPDLVRWDTTRGRHRWPTMKDGPHLWMTFLAWAAATRTGATSETWEVFSATVLEVSTLDDDDDGEDVGAPFPEDHEPDS
jgi:hypothetical protein